MALVAFVRSNGDPSVGINGNYAEVKMEWEFIDKDERESIRQQLKECFSAIWFEKATVFFDDETVDD